MVNTKVDDEELVIALDGMNEETVDFERSIVTVALVTAVAGPEFNRASVTVEAFCLSITVPSPQPVNVTVTDVPDAALTVPALQPVAVPERVKSAIARPDMDSL
jgi:hypothetical protein